MLPGAEFPPAALRPGSPFTIEMAGIPGAGKTTIYLRAATLLEADGLAVDRPLAGTGPGVPTPLRIGRKALRLGEATASAPLVSARVAWALGRSGQPKPIDLIARLVQVQIGHQGLRRAARTPGLSLLDEGLLQSLWSAGLRGRLEPLLRIIGATRGWPTPDMLVLVDTPPQVALSRLRARGSRHSRTQQLSAEDQLAELVWGAVLLDELVEWYRATKGSGCHVVRVDGSRPAEVSARSIVRQVFSRRGQSPGQARE